MALNFKRPAAPVAAHPNAAPIAGPGHVPAISSPPGVAPRPMAPPRAVAPGTSRFAGVPMAGERHPLIQYGGYRFLILDVSQGHNPNEGTYSFKSTLEVVAVAEGSTHQVGEQVAFIQSLKPGKQLQYALARVKSYVAHAAGFATDAEYDAFDPNGDFIESLLGTVNSFSQQGMTIVGRYVDCQATRGKAVEGQPGEFFHNYAWSVVPDEEQPQP